MREAEDPYVEWDAAYVLGALSPAERREYTRHLAYCPDCSEAVSTLEALPGMLAMVPAELAYESIENVEVVIPPAPPTRSTRLRTAGLARRNAGLRVAVGILAVAAAVVFVGGSAPTLFADRTGPVAMTQAIPSPITADADLVNGPWGTRIEVTCRYALPHKGPGRSLKYAMFVTDRQGRATQIASWTANPGSVMTFTAMTGLDQDDIAAVDIRLRGDRETVLLTMSLRA